MKITMEVEKGRGEGGRKSNRGVSMIKVHYKHIETPYFKSLIYAD
jgi:hypothetical protein